MFKALRTQRILKRVILASILLFAITIVLPRSVHAQIGEGIQNVDNAGIALSRQPLEVTIVKLIRIILGFLGLIAVSIVLYGGFVYMTSAGNEEKITKAKTILRNGLIGLAIILFSVIIVQFVINKLLDASGFNDNNSEVIGGGCTTVGGCTIDPCPSVFGAQSITPHQTDTGMNNIVIRAVFTKGVGSNVGNVLTIKRGDVDLTNQFSYAFVPGSDKKVIEAVMKSDATGATCSTTDAQNGVTCIPTSTTPYLVEVNSDISAVDGQGVEFGADACPAFTLMKSVNFVVDTVKNDVTPPNIASFGLVDPETNDIYSATEPRIPAGKSYTVESLMDDRVGVNYGGLGYAHFSLTSVGEPAFQIFRGPGSGVLSTDRYTFSEKINLYQDIIKNSGKPKKYDISMTGWDIDHNSVTVTSSFVLVGAACFNGVQDPGETDIDVGGECGSTGSCTENYECASGMCLSGQCAVVPQITNVDPMEGAVGNWVTVQGYNFGNKIGKVEFGGEDGWVEASLVQCTDLLSGSTWNNTYAIVEVPPQAETSNGGIALTGNGHVVLDPPQGELNEWTVGMWIYLDALSGTQPLFAIGTAEDSFNVVLGPDKRMLLTYVKDGSEFSSSLSYEEKAGLIKAKTWMFVTLSENTSGVKIMMLDGTQIFSAPALGKLDFPPGAVPQLLLGKTFQSTSVLKGSFDEVSVFPSYSIASSLFSSLSPLVSARDTAQYRTKIISLDPSWYWRLGDSNPSALYESLTKINAGTVEGEATMQADGIFGSKNIFNTASASHYFSFDVGGCDVMDQKSTTKGLLGPDCAQQNSPSRVLDGTPAYQFDGIDDYIDLNIPYSTSSDITIAARYKTTDFVTEQMTVLGGNAGGRLEMYLNRGKPSCRIFNSVSGQTILLADAAVVGDEWHHIACVVQYSPVPRTSLYVDGVLTKSADVVPTVISGGKWFVGKSASSGKPFKGVIDDVAIWNTSLGQSPEVAIRITTADGLYSDTTIDDFGAKPGSKQGYFTYNSTTRPGLCSVTVADGEYVGATAGPPGTRIRASGKGFGDTQSGSDALLLYLNPSTSVGGVVGRSGWTSANIFAQIPQNIAPGKPLIRIKKGGVESNGIPFQITQGDISTVKPLITEIVPIAPTPGSYITITGLNFGSAGTVFITKSANDTCVAGSLTDNCTELEHPPAPCQSTWQNTQIIVELPETIADTDLGTYRVIVERADNRLRSDGSDKDVMSISGGDPLPSFCAIDPESGPAILPPNHPGVSFYGKNFSANPTLYFWSGASKDVSVTSALDSDAWIGWNKDSEGDIFSVNSTETKILSSLPLDKAKKNPTLPLGQWPIRIRSDKGFEGNSVNYLVTDCRVDGSSNGSGLTCCQEGPDAGSWKTVCGGQTVTSGYVWRFTTGVPLQTPRVLEQCDVDGWFSKGNVGVVSPVPSTLWPDSANMCLNATVQVAFSSGVTDSSAESGVFMYECTSLTTPVKDCTSIAISPTLANNTLLKIVDGSFGATASVLKPNKAYRVVLTTDIMSVPQVASGGGKTQIPLVSTVTKAQKDGVLDGFVGDPAYYFEFTTGEDYCSLDSAYIDPSEKTVTVLGPLMSQYSKENPFYYYIFGKADRVCTVLGVGDLPWQWSSQNSGFASVTKEKYVVDGKEKNDRAKAEANAHAPNGVDFLASASTAGTILADQFGPTIDANSSTLRIVLGKPQVVFYEPNCAEACPNGVISVRFNRHMAMSTYKSGISLYECTNANCTTISSPVEYGLDSDRTDELQVVIVPNQNFKINTYYKVEVKDIMALKNLNTQELDGQMVEPFQWYFRTKQDGTLCAVDRVGVTPNPFTATYIGQKTKFSATPYGAPDACSSVGQKLSQWNSDYEYSWASTTSTVATISTFKQVVSIAPSCTQACVQSGSDVPFESRDMPLCGNGTVEAGEDCDTPGTNGCTMTCLLTTKTNTGTSKNFNPAVAGFCGDGQVGAQEDCDIAIQSDDMASTTQAYGCSTSCLHTGTPLAQSWCVGKTNLECASAQSVCGNGIVEVGEQCDRNDGNKNYCSPSCLYYDGNSRDAFQGVCGRAEEQCKAGTEGCTDICTWAGSSLLYSTPSLCGDGVVGVGEVALCEQSTSNSLQSTQAPLQIATARGEGQTNASGQQQTTINVTMPGQGGVTGSADYTLQCGYTEIATTITTSTISLPTVYNDCTANASNTLGVGSNSCCYPRPKRTSEYPENGSGFSTQPACRNTYVEAEFSEDIDPTTIAGNSMVVRGFASSDPSICATIGGENVTALVQTVFGTTDSVADTGTGFWNRLWYGVTRFVRGLISKVFAATNARDMQTWCTTDVTLSTDITGPSKKIPLYISNLLGTDSAETTYAVVLMGGTDGIATPAGVSIKNPAKPAILDVWAFGVGKEVCRIDSVGVAPSSHLFTTPNTASTFFAEALTKQGQRIVSTPAYAWSWSWSPTSTSIFDIPVDGASATSSTTQLGSTNVEGTLTAVARVTITEDKSAVGNQTGASIDGYTQLTSMFCERPWPVESTVVNGEWAPYQDARFNYSFRYCIDAGVGGDATDDLPALIPNVVVSSTSPTEDGTLKKVLFVSQENDDAIGLQIFANPDRLTAEEWYKATFPNAVPPQVISQPGGYDAIVVGDNYYINAVNVPDGPSGQVFHNIYLLTISQGAQASTHDVFDQIRDSFEFNTNLTDFQFCKNGAGQPDFQNLCTTDFACTATTTPGGSIPSVVGLCDAEKTKLHRDLSRLQHIETIQTALSNTSLPALNEGTFRKNYVSSKWASWGAFATALNTNLPQDPINTWEECGSADPTTCWDAQQSVFICPRDASVYEYEYDDEDSNYTLHVPMEFFTDEANLKTQFSAFIPTSESFTTVRGCVPLNSYSFTSLTCGDGVVGPGEQCDPPGSVSIGGIGSGGACIAGQYATQTCDATCHITYGSCTAGNSCGNGIVETGEVCDDGALNGKYGQCSAVQPGQEKNVGMIECVSTEDCGDGNTCTQNACIAGYCRYTEETDCSLACQGLHKQYCGNGVVDVDNNGNPLEFCDVSATGKSLYSPLKENSCKWDCQAYGSYCGDGVKDSAEACDDGNTTNADGCSVLCELENRACMLEKPQYKVYNEKTYITLESLTATNLTTFENTLVLDIATDKTQSVFVPGTPYPGCTTAITGNEICKSFGLSCDGIAQVIQSQTNNLSANQYGCNTNISTFDSDIQAIEKTHVLVCDGSFNGYISAGVETASPTETPVIPGCGNGKLDTGEQCDYMASGTKKFADCSALPYGSKSCTYCTEQCRTETTEPSAGFCGNGKIDANGSSPTTGLLYETCDINAQGEVVRYTTTTVVGPGGVSFVTKGPDVPVASCQIGKTNCANNCTTLDTSQCLACGLNGTGPLAKIVYLNPMLGPGQVWSPGVSGQYRAVLAHGNGTASKTIGLGGSAFGTVQTFQTSLPSGGDVRILSHNLCSVSSCSALNQCDGFGYRVSFSSGDIFSYPVSNEKNAVTNEYVISPAVPAGTIRVVVRWTKAEANNDHTYVGGLYSGRGFDYIGSTGQGTDVNGNTKGTHIGMSDLVLPSGSGWLCAAMEKLAGYWIPIQSTNNNCKSVGDGLPDGHTFIHPVVSVGNTFIQSFTIDTTKFDTDRIDPIAFYVSDASLANIFSSQNANVFVDIYTYHVGQSADYSIYKPTQTFEIKNAKHSTNSLARIWHVFNIIPDVAGATLIPGSTKWKIQPVQSVFTDQCDMEHSIYSEIKCPVSTS